MPKISPEIEAFARIKVVGVGGSGGNALLHMISKKVRGVEFVAVNTDAQDLHVIPSAKKIHIGKNLTRGLGTGMNPDLGRKAAEETIEEIQEMLKGTDMVFITCGLGGGTGTGAAPVIARTAREAGILTVAVVTKPFYFEGAQRTKLAEAGLEELRKAVDTTIVIPNDRLLAIVDKNTTFTNAFGMCDEILRQAVEGITDLITMPGIINVDFADIRAVMQNAGSALMGIGNAGGENRAEEAAKLAINSPLLDISIDGAHGLLFAIAGGDDLTMLEVQDAAKIITDSIDKEARVIFGAFKDERLKKGEIKVTVIATGFPNDALRRTTFTQDTSKTMPFVNLLEKKKEREDREEERVKEKEREKEREKKVIYNEMPMPAQPRKVIISDKTPMPPAEPKNDLPPDDFDDWSAIPAFLRRKK
jgi:cell division protein FtsZ